MPKPNQSTAIRRAKHVGKFGAVGIINTAIDFFLFNFLSKFVFTGTAGVIPSNVVSTTAAMTFSFFANKKLVFKSGHRSYARQVVAFLVTTAFGLYVIQTSIMYFLLHVWTAPLELAVSLVRQLGINLFNDNFYINNGAKVIATGASMAWNYVVYKKVVFTHHE